MLLSIVTVLVALLILLWSADVFVDNAASVAAHFHIPPLLIGMVIIGFGTSAPELLVSGLASAQGNPGIALGNAFGSNISNIALILGLTAIICPITVKSQILRKELPLLVLASLIAAGLMLDMQIARVDALMLLGVFAGLMVWTVRTGLTQANDALQSEVTASVEPKAAAIRPAILKLIGGLVLLVVSSRALVWGAVSIAGQLGVSDLLIGLTIVAVGTSLPELASSVVAARKGQHDLALGNILGSNLFNTLAVVGLAGAIRPLQANPEVLYRDLPVMICLTLSLFFFGYGFKRMGRINRFEGGVLLLAFVAYTAYLIITV